MASYGAPWVLEIGAPRGDSPESAQARQLFHAAQEAARREAQRVLKQAEFDRELDATCRRLWNDPAHWQRCGMACPCDP